MSSKAFTGLAIATGLVVVIGVGMQLAGGRESAAADLPEAIDPALKARINDVASIEVASGEDRVLVARQGDSWTVASSGGYPAKAETVKQALVGLADLKPREKKTADPARYQRLGLGEPAAGSETMRVTLLDAAGSQISTVTLGDSVQAGSTPQRYARAEGQPQSYLVEGRVNIPTDALQWLDAQILAIPRDRVTRVTIEHPDGETVALVREEGGSGFVLAEVPEGREAKPSGQLGAPANALAFLRFEDVAPAGDAPEAETTTTTIETGDGLTITATTWDADGAVWATFTAEARPDPAPSEGDETDAANTEESETDAAETDPAAPDDEPSAAAEAEQLNQKLAPWRFALPSFQATNLRKRMADLTNAATPPDPEEEADPEPTGFPGAPLLDAADRPGGGG